MNLSEEKLNDLENLLVNKQPLTLDLDEIIQEYSPGYFQVVLRSILKPVDLEYYRPILDRTLELQSPIFPTLLEELFVEKNFKEIPNILFFLDYLKGPVIREVQESEKLTIWAIKTASLLIKNSQNFEDGYLFRTELDDECFKILEDLNLLVRTEHYNIIRLAVNDRHQFNKKIDGIEPFEKLYRCWGYTFNLLNDSHRIAMIVIYNALQKNLFNNNGNALSTASQFSWTIDSYLPKAYSYFSDKTNDYFDIEKCNQIVWLLLKIYANDADKGIFKKYSNVNAEIFKICTNYLLLSPEEHLTIFNLFYRDSQYSKFATYGSVYKGAELSGSGGSGDGVNISLDDAPYVQKLLEPFLESFYNQSKLDLSTSSFIDYLHRCFIKNEVEPSSLNPILLRRASIKTLLKLLKDENILKRQCFRIFSSYLEIKKGIPSLSSKLFYELLNYENDREFLQEYGNDILKLIKRNLLSAYKGLIDEFAFRLLLVLRKHKVFGSKKLLMELINNPDFLSYDSFIYSILANIEKRLGINSPEMKFAVEEFLKNEMWQAKHGPYSFQVIARFIGAQKNVNSYFDSLNSVDPKLFQIIAPDLLRKESETDPKQAVRLIHQLLNSSPPHRIFEYTDFIPGVLEKYFDNFSVEEWEKNTEFMIMVFEICDNLLEDPDPGTPDEYHNRILENEEISIISTTRGYFAFSVRQLSCSKKYFEKAWYYTDKLLFDSNLYVVHEAFFSLYEILKRRQWNDQIKIKALNRLWEFFNKKNPKAIEIQIFHCFQVVRDLSEEDAALVLKRFSEFEGIAELSIFYAIFRINIKDWQSFDDKPFRSLLKEYISTKSSDFNHRILRIFSECIIKDNTIIDSIYPFLKLYIGEKYATQNLYNSLFSVFKSILNAEITNSKTEIMQLLNIILDSHIRYLSKAKGTPELYFGNEFLTILYKYSKKVFYSFLMRSLKIVALTNGFISTTEFKGILLSETDPEQSDLIKEVIDNYVKAFPSDYTFRKEWNAYATENKLI